MFKALGPGRGEWLIYIAVIFEAFFCQQKKSLQQILKASPWRYRQFFVQVFYPRSQAKHVQSQLLESFGICYKIFMYLKN